MREHKDLHILETKQLIIVYFTVRVWHLFATVSISSGDIFKEVFFVGFLFF